MVTLKAYLGIKYHADNRNREVIERISEVLAGCEITILCVARDLEKWGAVRLEPRDLMQQTFDLIDGCDLVVIELSEKGVGLGIEAGYAYACKIPVITIAKRGREVSETLRGISSRVIFYEEVSDLVPIFRDLFQTLNQSVGA